MPADTCLAAEKVGANASATINPQQQAKPYLDTGSKGARTRIQ